MTDKQYDNIKIEREGGITFVMLNRPEKRNAMSPELHFDMDDALDWLATDKETKVLVLGAIVRGETTHHEVLGHAVAGALAALSGETGQPIGFGLLTCDTMDQARQRSGKGAEAAEAAIAMANLKRRRMRG